MITNVIIAILITLIFSALFSGAEIAFMSSNKLRLELERKKDGFTSSILNVFYNNSEQFISAMLIGNMLTVVVCVIKMAELITMFHFTDSLIVIFIVQIIASVIVIVLVGEFIPKSLFRINPTLFLKVFSVPLFIFYIILYPIAVFVFLLATSILKIFGISFKADFGLWEKISLYHFLHENIYQDQHNKGVENEVKFFKNALDFSKVKIKDCIVPRTEVVAVPIETPANELLSKFIESGNSKLIVYNENIDSVIGYIDSAEMFSDPENWKSRIKPMPVVPETMPANKLMNLFTQQKKNIAVVVDEFGGTTGIITLEDIMEEILGEIEDEHDNKEYVAKKINNNQYILSGRLEIDSVNEQFNLNLPKSDSYVTMAGLLLYYFEKLPKANETIIIKDVYSFKIIKVAKNKIDLIKLTILSR